jgi:hypothetical protein
MKSALLAITMAATMHNESHYVSYQYNKANPIHVPRHHTTQTYMSQRRAAIKRRKSKSSK